MRNQADAVIIGGGIIGVAVAFYLAREKPGHIVLVEKEAVLGAGSTSKAAGGIRAQFASEINVRMSMLSEEKFRQFKEDTGSDALFDQVGYMFLLSTDEEVATFSRMVKMQQGLGLDVRMMTPDEVPKLAPHVRLNDIKMSTFCPQDGLGDPYEFLSGYEHAIRAAGVEIVFDAEVTGLEVESGRITTVKTKQGDVSTPLVINCAGAYSGRIAALAGAAVPVLPYPRQCVTTGELDWVKPFFPMVVDVASGLYFHKESKGLLLGWADKNAPSTFDTSLDPDYTDTILEKALDRIPQIETAEIANQWAGLYETTPDHHAIIGWAPEVKGLFHVTGFSGHGFMQAPAAGLIAARLIGGKEPPFDISALSPKRFAKGALVEEATVI